MRNTNTRRQHDNDEETLVKEYASTDAWATTSRDPLQLLAQALEKPVAKRVIKVAAAVAYAADVTCLIRVRTADIGQFEAARAGIPVGMFLQRQVKQEQARAQERALWFTRAKQASPDQY